MSIAWYIKLNILVLAFLFVIFLMKEISSPTFKQGLKNLFKTSPINRSARIETVKPVPSSGKGIKKPSKKLQDSH